ncbi:Indole-3-glycerol-phosphate synthase [Gloeothece citriformis PCC 7424]|uniref:Indole-3-glycerol phosphate synthase n=1 Tax=Gloeothece citriformis (strain PCC 7424) TaxID=65393 RepID=B7KHK1_GLOC7|nr:indole-3-glycerol phosphate synthase TrpC [Gloeothece citriformis]ACK70696.1 Indole-3-glycerol-phosphate synthase [Gloeothece citriformis PCC 7424]
MQTYSPLSSETAQQKTPTILAKIVEHKKQEVAKLRSRYSKEELQHKIKNISEPKNFLRAIKASSRKPSLIAEVKKASPSKGIIRADFDPVKIAQAYQLSNAACLSVLTDEKFFCGSFDNLFKVRQAVSLPLLCKEFIIDPIQITLARLKGADAVLLIAAILSDQDLQFFLNLIQSLGMEALIEVHTALELDRVLKLSGIRLLGINNRNLEDFSVDLNTTDQLINRRRKEIKNLGITVVSESGLYTKTDLDFVLKSGADAVLIGESLVKQTDIETAVNNLYSEQLTVNS